MQLLLEGSLGAPFSNFMDLYNRHSRFSPSSCWTTHSSFVVLVERYEVNFLKKQVDLHSSMYRLGILPSDMKLL